MKQLVDTHDEFYITEQSYLGATYHIFNYRLCSYNDFNDISMECRGSMFRVDESPVLVCRPMKKFFNLQEILNNSETFPIKTPLRIFNKIDGSLISTFINSNGDVDFKSKGSLYSEHAQKARELFNQSFKNYDRIIELTRMGYTVNLELVSPNFQIVIPYEEETLKILNIIDNETGEYLQDSIIETEITIPTGNFQEWIENVFKDTRNIEGYVVEYELGAFYKLKTYKYIHVHNIKSYISNKKNIAEAVLLGHIDDVYETLKNCPDETKQIQMVENEFKTIHNHIMENITNYYEKNKDLERKPFAIKAKKELNNVEFKGVMSLFSGKSLNYLGRLILKNHFKSN